MEQYFVGLIALIPLLALALGGVVFYFDFYTRIENISDRKASREIRLTRYHYDPNGNPEYYYNPANNSYFIPGNGNPLNPPQNLFVNGVQQQLKTKEKSPAKLIEQGEDKGLLDDAAAAYEQAEQAEQAEQVLRSLEETGDYLISLKQKGVGKSKALELIGVKRGRNIPYNTWSAFWENIVVTENSAPYLK